jgi:hypothetical protein
MPIARRRSASRSACGRGRRSREALLARQSYYDATGAPAWSGGQYDGFDGRVRLPIGGLTSSLTAELDDILLHELTHAFVADISRGIAPREIHEGLAQLMEGKRSQALLGEEGSRALADGRLQGVGGFEAFRSVYGKGLDDLRQDWATRLRQRYGS